MKPARPEESAVARRNALRSALAAPDRCLIMGILNVTPDSFSDGGRFSATDAAVAHALSMAAAGADLVDIGGESSRPGASPVTAGEEQDRVLPVLEALRPELRIPVSVDTCKAEVMRSAVAAGADMINDIRALQMPGALDAAVSLGVPVCLMHMQGEPRTMQRAPAYGDVVADVTIFLRERVQACLAAGVPAGDLVIDPGFGFGKLLEHNLALFAALPDLVASGFPVLAGVSRKRMIGELLGDPGSDRTAASVALAIRARDLGVRVVRVHDVAETASAFRALDGVAAGTGVLR